MASHRVYYKGEGGGFSQIRAVVSLVCPCCPWFVLASRVLQLCTNHLVWVVCKLVWVSEACQLFLIPSRSSNTPLYPSKCCELGSVPRPLLLLLFSTWAHIWAPLRSWECVNQALIKRFVYQGTRNNIWVLPKPKFETTWLKYANRVMTSRIGHHYQPTLWDALTACACPHRLTLLASSFGAKFP